MSPIYVPGKVTLRQTWQPMDPDAAAYITAVETADGQALEEKVKIAIDNFVLGCKADGIWSAIKASCILAGARTLNGALVPLVGTAPTNYNFVAGDYNRETGLKGDGSTKYLDSNRANNADPQNSSHNAVYVTGLDTLDTTSVVMAGGVNQAGANNLGYSATYPNTFLRNRSGSPNSPASGGGQGQVGLFGTSRNNSANYEYFIDGLIGTLTQTSQTPDSGDVLIFNRLDGAHTDARLAFYSIGESLDLALLDARVTDLITAIGVAIP
jgi:hypothetical protein